LPACLRTERLVLRPFAFGDTEDVVAYANDAEWSTFLPVPFPYGRGDAETFIAQRVLEEPQKGRTWTLEYEERAVGGINVSWDVSNRSAELGWSVARRLWGQGLTTEAARAVSRAAFAAWEELNRIEAMAFGGNGASLRVMEKLGMQREGHLRQKRLLKGEFHDEVWYSLLRHEWEKREDG